MISTSPQAPSCPSRRTTTPSTPGISRAAASPSRTPCLPRTRLPTAVAAASAKAQDRAITVAAAESPKLREWPTSPEEVQTPIGVVPASRAGRWCRRALPPPGVRCRRCARRGRQIRSPPFSESAPAPRVADPDRDRLADGAGDGGHRPDSGGRPGRAIDLTIAGAASEPPRGRRESRKPDVRHEPLETVPLRQDDVPDQMRDFRSERTRGRFP